MTKVADINTAARQVSDIINSIKGELTQPSSVSNVDLGSSQSKVSDNSINKITETLSKNRTERG
ncbi:MAG: hypothetical protein WC490_04885 [Candidatus Margulisiibacteriota bacterium]